MEYKLAGHSVTIPQRTTLLRVAWGVLALLVLYLLLRATPLRYAELAADRYRVRDALAAIGVSQQFFAAYFTGLEAILSAGFFMVAALIVWRWSGDRLTLLAAVTLLLVGILSPLVEGFTRVERIWLEPVIWLRYAAVTGMLALILLFPNGRFVPRWGVWLLPAWFIFSIIFGQDFITLLSDTSIIPNTDNLREGLFLLAFMSWAGAAVIALLIRYRQHSKPDEQQQMRWVLIGFAAIAVVAIINALFLIAVPAIQTDPILNIRYTFVAGGSILLATLLLPLTLAFALFRYRLWQTELILNRTLVYGGLTLAITVTYLLLVGGAGIVAAGQSARILGLMVATGLIALAIRPLRQQLQRAADQLVPSTAIDPGSLEANDSTGPKSASPLRNGVAEPGVVASNSIRQQLTLVISVMVIAAFIYSAFTIQTIGNLGPLLNKSQLIVVPVMVLVPVLMGWLIERKHPGHKIGLLFLLAASFAAVAVILLAVWLWIDPTPPENYPVTISILEVLGETWYTPAIYIPLFLIPLYFPTGRLLSPRWRRVVVLIVGVLVANFLNIALRPWPIPSNNIMRTRPINGLPGSEPFFDSLIALAGVAMVAIVLLVFLSLVLRFRRAAGAERAQIKLPLITIAVVIGLSLTMWFVPPLSALDERSGWTLSIMLPMLFPVSIGVAILFQGLWDFNLIINRTLVYGGLTLAILAVYVLVVGGLGTLFQTQGNLGLALLATGLIAVLFQPLRQRLQRGANRLMFGERDDPYAVLSQLGQQLQTTTTPEETLQSAVKTVSGTLKLPYVAVELSNAHGRLGGATTGEAVAETVELPLRYQNEAVGHLVVSPRSPGETFTRREQQLLADIAAQMGAMAYSMRITAALQRSREKLVLAREEERRRIRRDLHDELGPTLASQMFALDTAIDLLEVDPQAAAELLQSLKLQNKETVSDIRRLVYELRPPSLDELGLIGALQAHAGQLAGGQRLDIHITSQPDPLPPLSAAVDVAAYRIILEAVNNAVRHANAGKCTVLLHAAENERPHLLIEVTDDGDGLPSNLQPGVGLNSMRERAEELGGNFQVVAGDNGGTRVTAVLPFAWHENQDGR